MCVVRVSEHSVIDRLVGKSISSRTSSRGFIVFCLARAAPPPSHLPIHPIDRWGAPKAPLQGPQQRPWPKAKQVLCLTVLIASFSPLLGSLPLPPSWPALPLLVYLPPSVSQGKTGPPIRSCMHAWGRGVGVSQTPGLPLSFYLSCFCFLKCCCGQEKRKGRHASPNLFFALAC